jgi:hypothetical protein
MRPARAAAIVVAVVLLCVGCGGLARTLGPRYIASQIADELALDATQTARTREAIERLLKDAPKVLKAPVGRLFDAVDRAIALGFDERRLDAMKAQGDALADTIAQRVIAEAAPILASMRPAQIDQARERFDERLAERRAPLEAPPPERRSDRVREALKWVEKWTGELSAAQSASLKRHVTMQPDDLPARLDAEVRRADEMERLMRAGTSSTAMRDALWRIWKTRSDWGPGARSEAERRADARKTVYLLDGMVTPAQRKHARAHLAEMRAEFEAFLEPRDSGWLSSPL